MSAEGLIAEFDRALARWELSEAVSPAEARRQMSSLRANPAALHILRARGGNAEAFILAMDKAAPAESLRTRTLGIVMAVLLAMNAATCIPMPKPYMQGRVNPDGSVTPPIFDPLKHGGLDGAVLARERIAERLGIPYFEARYQRCVVSGFWTKRIKAFGQTGDEGLDAIVRRRLPRSGNDDLVVEGSAGNRRGRMVVTMRDDGSCIVQPYPSEIEERVDRAGGSAHDAYYNGELNVF